ncbi:hypothetical protein [Dethiobacter alkaliphilus]|uniref:Uncharacterized protein n=1 Tax=Dethiobacter alkaliphilus AHT 1 TaxID=555088 RepID=C0GEU0_DETAL|nr:hypothetical protein [Dethiobacter alkaliphilus]EEG78122.1 hypothetical protein DealDRAFT_0999 [Dethiobacter alkaliphilus AHT 1]
MLKKLPGFRSGTPWKMAVGGFFYALLLMVIVIAVIDPSSEEAASEPPQAQEPQRELTQEEAIEAVFHAVVGEKSNHSNEDLKERVQKVTYNEGIGFVHIEAIANDNLTQNAIRGGMLLDAKKLYSVIFDELSEVDTVDLTWYFPLVDQRGNESLDKVMTFTYTRENAATVNWDNVLTDNVGKVADSFWQHPAVE